jgi:hypothetical protein
MRADRFEIDTKRFESFQGSQPRRSLPRVFRHSRKCRHSRGLAANRRVSGKENPTFSTEGGPFRGRSLLREFSISEIRQAAGPETGCVLAETGSKCGNAQAKVDVVGVTHRPGRLCCSPVSVRVCKRPYWNCQLLRALGRSGGEKARCCRRVIEFGEGGAWSEKSKRSRLADTGTMTLSDRDVVFISHATPDDNEFVRWLGTRLSKEVRPSRPRCRRGRI